MVIKQITIQAHSLNLVQRVMGQVQFDANNVTGMADASIVMAVGPFNVQFATAMALSY